MAFGALEHLEMVRIFENTAFDFVGKRSLFFVLSGIAALLGVVALIQMGRGEARLGVDFSGGAAILLKFEKPLPIGDARKALAAAGLKDAELQEVIAANKLLIRIRSTGGSTEKTVSDIFSKAYPQNPFVVESSTDIGPKIGKKLQKDALLAIALSVIGIIFYIMIRFEFLFSIAAIIAVLHDVLVILGIFYFMDKEITILFMTALLTIAGYSLSDTVVLFDRIRENLKSGRHDLLSPVINRSINEVLSRTFNTSFSTLLVVVALLFLGGEVIHDFALAMTLGIVIGTYSSWFVAGSLLIVLKRDDARVKRV